MTRRKIMRSMLITLGIAAPGLLGRAATASAGALSRNLKELLGDIDSARAIGECHLAERPTETYFRHIISMLAADGFMIDTPIDQPRLVCRQLRARIRQDFAEGRIVVVDSWHMSATEVRLCTLAALEIRNGRALSAGHAAGVRRHPIGNGNVGSCEGFRMPADPGGAAGAEGRRRKAAREDAMGR